MYRQCLLVGSKTEIIQIDALEAPAGRSGGQLIEETRGDLGDSVYLVICSDLMVKFLPVSRSGLCSKNELLYRMLEQDPYGQHILMPK